MEANPSVRAPIEARRFGWAGRWVSLGSFTADGASEPGRRLEAVVKELEVNRAELAAADVIVLDVRGNTGVSSPWGRRVAAAIWGVEAARAATPRSEAVDWRASEANIAGLRALGAEPASGFRLRAWVRHISKGMERARAENRAFWRETPIFGEPLSGARHTGTRRSPATSISRPVFVLTDSACVSACLDALDVWLTLGAVHVGRETSADSLDMEMRRQPLPSGLSTVSVPMKVYRGRPRAGNQPYRPVHTLDSDLNDTRAVEAEILRLESALGASTL